MSHRGHEIDHPQGSPGPKKGRVGGGAQPTHHCVSLGLSLPCPGATAEGSGPSGLPQQVIQKWAARGRVSGRLAAKGLSLFFGKALQPAPDRAGWHGSGKEPMCRVGGGWEKGALGPSPSSWVLLPGCTELQEGPKEEAHGWSRTLPSGLPQAPSPFRATKEGEASPLAAQPHGEDQQQTGRGKRRPILGATQPQIQAKKPVWPCSLLPIGSLQAGTGAPWT